MLSALFAKLVTPVGMIWLVSILLAFAAPSEAAKVRIKDIAEFQNNQEVDLIGYGLITGLAGTGDSRRSRATLQSVSNLLEDLGINVDIDDVNSRNVAAVTVTATLPAFTRAGDKMDIPQ